MKTFIRFCCVCNLALMLTGCGDGIDEAAAKTTPPPVAESTGGSVSEADQKLMDTMAPGGTADPDQGS